MYIRNNKGKLIFVDMSKINNNQSPNASANATSSNSNSVNPRKTGPQ